VATTRAAIRAIRSALPEGTLTNEQLAAEFENWDSEKILKKTGIGSRRIAAPDQTAADLGFEAAEKLLNSGVCEREDIDLLLFCTQSPDYFLPTSACVMQDRLGLPTSTGAFDFNLGCSGFVYGLSMAKAYIESGMAKNVLLVTAETYSKHIHPKDRSTRTIFGDGAAATLISATESEQELIGPFLLATDGSGAENLMIPVGGMRNRPGPGTSEAEDDGSGNVRAPENLYMNGPSIFNFTIRTVPGVVTSLLEKAGITLEDVDHFIYHQANEYMLNHLRRRSKIPQEKFPLYLEEVGNTVSPTIPLTIEAAVERGEVARDAYVMLVGFGVGYSWAACMARLAL